MRIVICCSMRYRRLIKEVLENLNAININAVFRNIDLTNNNSTNKKRFALEHFDDIKESDTVYFINPNGYMGNSCKIELGYALALGKAIYFSEKTGDIDFDCYAKKLIPTNNLELFKK